MHKAIFTVEKAFGVWQSSFIWFLLNSRTLNQLQKTKIMRFWCLG